jgi:sigma-B regulation protein RsbU (phosphoserine phosphatase)
MQSEPLKILFIGNDAQLVRAVGELLRKIGPVEFTAETALDAGFAALKKKSFQAVLFELPSANVAGLFQVTALAVKIPRVPVIVFGSTSNEEFAVEAVRAGAQDYLVKGQFDAAVLHRTIRYAIERQQERVTLVKEKEDYYGLFDHLVEGIFRTTIDGHYVLANVALARIYGYKSPIELMASITDIGRNLYVKPERRDEFVKLMQTHDTLTDFKSEIYRKDGSIIWISENCRAVRDANGELLYYEGTVEDITHGRETELNLRNSESLYHSLVESIPLGVFRRDLQGRFTFANQPYCKYHRVKPEDIVGKTDFDLYPKKAAEKYWQDDLNIMKNGKTVEILEETQPVGMEEKHYHHVVKTPLYSQEGRLIGLQGIFWDVTEQRQMEENLRNSESLYHSLVETMPQNVFRKDLKGRFTFANKQYCKHYNCKLEDILGKTDFDFFPKELAEKYTKDDERVMETGQTYEIVEEHHPLGQEKTIVQVVKTPLYGTGGKIIGLQGIFWDVTEQRLAEERIRAANTALSLSREELRTKNQIMQESLRMAHEIQLTMLPQQYPLFPHTVAPEKSAFQFAHRYHPAETVSGDFFSISPLSDNEVGVFICDVTGHGVRAALVTAMIRALVEELKPIAHDPGMFLRKLNSDLCVILKTTGTPMLTTAFYLTANWETGVMRFANAGHPKPLLVRRLAGKVEPLANASGRSQPALGLFDDPPYQTSETGIAPGDFAMLFTDGLYEVQGPNEELYSQERLMLDVQNLINKPSGQLFDDLLEAVRAFAVNHEFEDDVCLVGMEFAGKPK